MSGAMMHKGQQEDAPLHPSALQRQASNPHESIWVSASAGTGKTKVLTDRVLRLMLPRFDGAPATLPHKILCLTFTKAAASEMAVRINETLGRWSVLPLENAGKPENSLIGELEDLLGAVPSEAQIEAAQRLFAQVMDCPGGLQIMTIHAFCQSVLGRFPLEAGLAPHFVALDEVEAGALMAGAQAQVLHEARMQPGSALADALERVSGQQNEEQFSTLLRNMAGEAVQLKSVMKRFWDLDGVYARLCDFYKIDQGRSETDILREACADAAFDKAGLSMAVDALRSGKGKTEQGFAPVIDAWVKGDVDARLALYDDYKRAFLTTEGRARKSVISTKATNAAYPACEEILQRETARLEGLEEEMARAQSAMLTRDVLALGLAIVERYEALKRGRGALDFNDMIVHTAALLSGQAPGFEALAEEDKASVPLWVMYKLDQGLDHILVDEAQDTNPEQWQIIDALWDEFFSGLGARGDALRTAFTVGDIKQSIYGFQRAAPAEFKRMQGVMDARLVQAGLDGRSVALSTSFRSVQAVLDVVDAVFAPEAARAAVGEAQVLHRSFRDGQAGLVELWPVFETQKREKQDFWRLPVEISEGESGASALARKVAEEISGWITRKEELPAYGRPIEAGDIMILVRTRSKLVEMIVRELKRLCVPVSGADRMMLGEQLVVQDMLVLAQFCLLPDDDLTLACALKSPFLGWSEEELFSLSYGRKGSLWAELNHFDTARLKAIEDAPDDMVVVSEDKRGAARAWLSQLITDSRNLGIYAFFSRILQAGCPVDERSGMRAVVSRLGDDALDPLDELLNTALLYGRKEADNLQMFLSWMEGQEIQIKREMEERGGHVRIMTVHGSKGLQAPIVILPDTIDSGSKKAAMLLWPDKTGLDVPLWTPRKEGAPKAYLDVQERCKALEEEERHRLLYVAMTRAADRLYVAGHLGQKAKLDGSWYAQIDAALRGMDGMEALEGGALRYETVQAGAGDKIKGEETVQQRAREACPSWLFEDVPTEPVIPKPLRPSRLGEDDMPPAVVSPLRNDQNSRFLRGNVTHKLLQFLPDFAPENRRHAAQSFVFKHVAALEEDVQNDIVDEVMNILQRPDYAMFFDARGMAEVPITALSEGGQVISGQIDRLVVLDDRVWILDYKTNRPPPKRAEGVPQVYIRQMAAYRETIARLYPGREIVCGLLWTDGPDLMVLPQ